MPVEYARERAKAHLVARTSWWWRLSAWPRHKLAAPVSFHQGEGQSHPQSLLLWLETSSMRNMCNHLYGFNKGHYSQRYLKGWPGVLHSPAYRVQIHVFGGLIIVKIYLDRMYETSMQVYMYRHEYTCTSASTAVTDDTDISSGDRNIKIPLRC